MTARKNEEGTQRDGKCPLKRWPEVEECKGRHGMVRETKVKEKTTLKITEQKKDV